jgi:hypothetical protein
MTRDNLLGSTVHAKLLECGSVGQPRFGCIPAHDPLPREVPSAWSRDGLDKRPPPSPVGLF